MKRHTLQWIGIGSLAIVLPVAASAQQAFARGPMDLRAGPAGSYPLVANIAPGQPVQVMGCVNGYAWCDVVLPDGLRGWAYAGSLDYAYQDQRVPLASYGAYIGVPIVAFSLGAYWSNYYRDRPWYNQPSWWGGRPPPPVVGWRPPPPGVPGWHPNPYPAGGWGPRPGYRPPGPGYHPPGGGGYRPPPPGGYHPGGPPPGGHPPGFGRPPGGGGHPPGGGGHGGGGGGGGGHGGGGGGGGGGGRP